MIRTQTHQRTMPAGQIELYEHERWNLIKQTWEPTSPTSQAAGSLFSVGQDPPRWQDARTGAAVAGPTKMLLRGVCFDAPKPRRQPLTSDRYRWAPLRVRRESEAGWQGVAAAAPATDSDGWNYAFDFDRFPTRASAQACKTVHGAHTPTQSRGGSRAKGAAVPAVGAAHSSDELSRTVRAEPMRTDCVRRRRWRPLGRPALEALSLSQSQHRSQGKSGPCTWLPPAGCAWLSNSGSERCGEHRQNGAGAHATVCAGEALDAVAFVDVVSLARVKNVELDRVFALTLPPPPPCNAAGAPQSDRSNAINAAGAHDDSALAAAQWLEESQRMHGAHTMVWDLSGRPDGLGVGSNALARAAASRAASSKAPDTPPWPLVAPRFRGCAVPPLPLLCSLCAQIQAWLDADPCNFAVVTCRADCRRSNLLLAVLVAWSAREGSGGDVAVQALEAVARLRYGARFADVVDNARLPVRPRERERPRAKLAAASEWRYAQYADQLLIHGRLPLGTPKLLSRIVLHSVPRLAWRRIGQRGADDCEALREEGCRPVFQLFKGGKLVFSTSWPVKEHSSSTSQPVRWVSDGEGGAVFDVNTLLSGDCTLRAAHVKSSNAMAHRAAAAAGGQKSAAGTTICVTAFHAGYIGAHESHQAGSEAAVLHLTRSDLDGIDESDTRFSPDFWIELIFAPVITIASDGGNNGEGTSACNESAEALPCDAHASSARIEAGLKLPSAVLAPMLKRDEALWHGIRRRRAQMRYRRARVEAKQAQGIGLDDIDASVTADDTAANFGGVDVHGTPRTQEQLQQLTLSAALPAPAVPVVVLPDPALRFDVDDSPDVKIAAAGVEQVGRASAPSDIDVDAVTRELDAELAAMRELEQELGLDPLSDTLERELFDMDLGSIIGDDDVDSEGDA